MDPNPNPHPTDAQAEPEPKAPEKRFAALSLRGADLPPDFAAAEIDDDMEADADAEDDEEEEEEGYLTAASRGGSSSCATAAWKEEMEGLDEDAGADADAGPPSPSSSGYAAERGSSLASSGGIVEPEPEGHAAGAEDWARDKKHLDEDDASASWRKRKKIFLHFEQFRRTNIL